MRFILPMLALSALGTAPRAQSYELPIREKVFDNGLRLLVLERPKTHRVACKIFFDMGALGEAPGELGAAHFLEHLMFKGTHSLGTTDWPAEKPLIDDLYAAEAALIEARNRARNELRQRGVFHDYQHAETTGEIDRLETEIARIDGEIEKYRVNGEMMRWYQAFGGTRLTASTEQEYMKFDINLPRNRVELFLRVEADRMTNAVFREFDRERMILVEQRFGDLSNPATAYYEALNATVGDIHPVYWPEGYLTDFDVYTRHGEREIYEEFFRVNNATLVFVGGVSLEEMIPLVEKYFGSMERAPAPTRVAAIEPLPQAERRMIWRSDRLSPRVELRYEIPGIGHPDRPHFDVLAEVAAIQIGRALADSGIDGTANVNTRVVHTDRFGVPATLNFEVILSIAEDLANTEVILRRVLGELEDQPVDIGMLAFAKKRLRTAWYRTAADPDQLAFEIGHFQIMDRWQTLGEHLRAREQTTPAVLLGLAKRYFTPENLTVGIVQPPDGNGSGGGQR